MQKIFAGSTDPSQTEFTLDLAQRVHYLHAAYHNLALSKRATGDATAIDACFAAINARRKLPPNDKADSEWERQTLLLLDALERDAQSAEGTTPARILEQESPLWRQTPR